MINLNNKMGVSVLGDTLCMYILLYIPFMAQRIPRRFHLMHNVYRAHDYFIFLKLVKA